MRFETIIRSATIVDGTGARAPYAGDVAICGDRIAAVGNLDGAQAATAIEARGRVIAPGFVDVHVHSEIALLGSANSQKYSEDQLAGVRQGVTTNLMSPDGFGWAPLSPQAARAMWRYTQFAYGEAELSLNWPTVQDYLATFEGRTPANVYPQVPHGAVRLRTMGWKAGPANDKELLAMSRTVREWIAAGAGAISLGLDYQPGANANLHELVSLARIAGEEGAIYAAHQRSQTLGRVGAWQETMALARQAEIPVHISHERVDDQTEKLLDQADREALDLTFECYLYPAGMTHLAYFLPPEVQRGSLDEMLQRMQDPRVRHASLSHLSRKLGPVGNQTIGYTNSGRYVGQTLAQAAQSASKSWAEFVYDLVLDEEGIECAIVPWQNRGSERIEILRHTAVHPRALIASDGIYGIPHPHPRGHGCFAHVLRQYVHELGLLSLQEAVYKMSGLPAQRFGLRDRGAIAVGKAADLVLFDPDTVTDRATWREPRLPPDGIDWVFVNGETVLQDGTPTGRQPGRVLHRSN
jgi:N-acyl-D-amino-acid deacylase